VKIWEKSLGPEHPITKEHQGNLSAHMEDIKRWQKYCK
jgi:hypothetical protein